MASSPGKRISQHFNNRGAKWTRLHNPQSVQNIIEYRNQAAAKRGERSIYYKMKNKFGLNKVRGAGNTRTRYTPTT